MGSNALEQQIARISLLTDMLNDSKEININDLVDITAAAQDLINQILNITNYVQNLELKRFLEEMFLVTEKLHQVAIGIEDDIDPPNTIMRMLTSNFEHFTNKIISKENRKGMRDMASYVLALDGVLRCCETIPYYWHIANRQQKVAMVLGATLVAAAVGLLIASHVAPALVGIALLPQAVICAVYLSKGLYNKIVQPTQEKFDAMQQIPDVKKNLEEQKVLISSELENVFSNIEDASNKTFVKSRISGAHQDPAEQELGYMTKGVKKITKMKDQKSHQEQESFKHKKATRNRIKKPRNPKENEI